jgi:ABC-type transport system involved in multi-copper enzyme maturation permease subunit
MLARLWWKEWRAFGPIWLILGLAAAGLQWLFFSTRSEDVRSGALTPAALAWAVFYAFAAGSAAFAGERDSRTLGFLDALPVARPTLWLGKATFALASTFGLALLLAILAAVGTQTRDPAGAYGYGPIVRMFGTLLFEAVAWGFLWSSFSKNPLLAGAMSVVSVAVISIYSNLLISTRNLAASTNLVDPEAVPARLLLASAALAASAFIVCLRHWTIGKSIAEPSAAAAARRREIPARRASAAWSLDWQAWREGWTTGLLVAILGLVVPIMFRILGSFQRGPIDLILAVLAGLLAGVAVFGAEGGSATPRFLVQHGVTSGLVWARRIWIWGLGMAALLAIFLLIIVSTLGPILPPRGPSGLPQPGYEIVVIAAIVIDAFAVGIVCGMAIPRRITAVLVGVMGMLAIAPVQVALATMGMVPGWTLLLTPAILLGVSRAWAGDWMSDREGARPWVRLGLLLVVPLGILGSAFVAWRAWGEPDVGPQFKAASTPVEAIPPGQDAVEEYRRAIAKLSPGLLENEPDLVIVRGWDRLHADVVSFWNGNRASIELARKASAMPGSRLEDVERLSVDLPQGQVVQGVRILARLVGLDTRERMSRGDLPGAWEDIFALFRMAQQLTSTTPTLVQMVVACQIHHQAVGLAIDWAGDPRQTPETIRSARDDLKRLPPLPSMAGALRVESLILDRTFDLSAEELERFLGSDSMIDTPTGSLIFTRLIAPPWERVRARRVCRRLVAEMLPDLEREPWERSAGTNFDVVPEGSRLARWVFPACGSVVNALDREVVGRRALEQVLALRSWQLGHGGPYPETLEALVPGELERLPIDPYSGKPFGYVRSEGQPIHLPILPDNPARSMHRPGSDRSPTRPGQPLLYSVGPNLVDDTKNERIEVRLKGIGDIVFPLP